MPCRAHKGFELLRCSSIRDKKHKSSMFSLVTLICDVTKGQKFLKLQELRRLVLLANESSKLLIIVPNSSSAP